MKAIITLSIVLLFGAIAQAQSEDPKAPSAKKTAPQKYGVTATKSFDFHQTNDLDCVFLSKFKNTRVKKALSFTTRNNKPKMA